MKKIAIISMILTLFFIILGCSSTAVNMKEKSTATAAVNRSGVINENYVPPIFDENELQIKNTISPESKSDEIDVLLNQTSGQENLPEEIDGYRVQICAIAEEDQARSIQREAMLRFMDQNVYLRYDNPYYKVRVGDCLSRYDAEQLQNLAVEKGFTDAWVVRTRIKPNLSNSQSPPIEKSKSPN